MADELAGAVTRFIAQRQRGVPLGRTASAEVMAQLLEGAINERGLGTTPAWELVESAVVPNTITLNSPRFLAFIPLAPSAAAVWMDAAVGAASFSAESWLESSGAVAAENQALDLLARLIGLPPDAGGCFTSGGSSGNLSALAVAREWADGKRLVAVADTAHASVRNTLHLLGLEREIAFVAPTTWKGEPVGRLVFLHPETTNGIVDEIVATLR